MMVIACIRRLVNEGLPRTNDRHCRSFVNPEGQPGQHRRAHRHRRRSLDWDEGKWMNNDDLFLFLHFYTSADIGSIPDDLERYPLRFLTDGA